MFFDHPDFDAHESVSVFHDAQSGLRAVVAVHSTHLGPSSGGTRFWTYDGDESAVADVLRLSQAMSYKTAMAGLALGGGKAVVMHPSGAFDRTDLFAAYGRMLERLNGSYITAEDVGVSPADMDIIAGETAHVTGTTLGGGDPSPYTARGIFLAIAASVQTAFGEADLRGRRIAVQGLGSVGYRLAEHLYAAGAKLVVADIDADAVMRAVGALGAEATDTDRIHASKVDVFAPCALGGAVNSNTVHDIAARVVAGGANNQLATDDMGEALRARGILFAPDYIANAGGIINVAAEIGGYNVDWVMAKVEAIPDTLRNVFARAAAQDRPTADVADEIARKRIGR